MGGSGRLCAPRQCPPGWCGGGPRCSAEAWPGPCGVGLPPSEAAAIRWRRRLLRSRLQRRRRRSPWALAHASPAAASRPPRRVLHVGGRRPWEGVTRGVRPRQASAGHAGAEHAALPSLVWPGPTGEVMPLLEAATVEGGAAFFAAACSGSAGDPCGPWRARLAAAPHLHSALGLLSCEWAHTREERPTGRTARARLFGRGGAGRRKSAAEPNAAAGGLRVRACAWPQGRPAPHVCRAQRARGGGAAAAGARSRPQRGKQLQQTARRARVGAAAGCTALALVRPRCLCLALSDGGAWRAGWSSTNAARPLRVRAADGWCRLASVGWLQTDDHGYNALTISTFCDRAGVAEVLCQHKDTLVSFGGGLGEGGGWRGRPGAGWGW